MLSGGLRTKGITKQSQEDMPLITVVTVVRNSETMLEETILSVINQTYANIEYIVIDGASTDGTLDIVRKYEDRIDYWMSEPDKGIYDAMNKGIDLATGDWINFMNSGDKFYSEKIIQNIFGKNNTEYIRKKYLEEADILYGDVFLVHAEESYIQRAESLDTLNKDMAFSHQSSFVRSELLKDRKFDVTYKSSGDYHFLYHCYKNNKNFMYIPYIISAYDANNGVSLDYKLRNYENARIKGIEKKLNWRIKYIAGYAIYRFKQYLKKILPPKIVKYIKSKKLIFCNLFGV